MEALKNIVFTTSFVTVEFLLLKLLILAVLSVIFVWLINFAIIKLRKKLPSPRDYAMKIVFLQGLLSFFVFFAVYLFILVKSVGIHNFRWGDGYFYLGILPEILLYLFTIGFFLFRISAFRKQLK